MSFVGEWGVGIQMMTNGVNNDLIDSYSTSVAGNKDL